MFSFSAVSNCLVLKAKIVSPSFAHLVVEYISFSKGLPIKVYDCTDGDLGELQHMTSMSFLGSYSLFYIKNVESLSDKKRTQFISFLSAYAGQHVLLLFVSSDFPQFSEQTLELNEFFSLDQLKELVCLFENDTTAQMRKIGFYSALSRQFQFTPDMFAKLWCYAGLVGARVEQFSATILPYLVTEDYTLFELSTAFFARDAKKFMKMFDLLNKEFQAPFWVAYFSEQLFRAFWYIYFKKNNKLVDAQKIAYRLPYSFVQKDWKLHNCKALATLHDKLYRFDCDFKHGGFQENLSCILLEYLVQK
jgi:hypothetical protein